MGTRITQRDVAREAGVSHATVSLALSGHPGISPETTERIRSIAKRLGYIPDPMLTALSVYRRNQKQAAYRANLGWINSSLNPKSQHGGDFGLYFDGARERALASGYKLEEICLVDYGNDVKRLSKSLQVRGIKGLLIAPVDSCYEDLHLDWDQFSAVRFGYSMHWPVLHTVTNSQFRSARTAVEHLVELGYRRIGFMSSENFDQRTGGQFSGGYYVGMRMAGLAIDIPLFTYDGDKKADWEKHILSWIEKYRLDCILSDNWFVPEVLTKKLGVPVPEKMGFASFAVFADDTYRAGINQKARKTGAAAVDQLIALLHRNEKGIPDTPVHTLIEGEWQSGQTVRDVNEEHHSA